MRVGGGGGEGIGDGGGSWGWLTRGEGRGGGVGVGCRGGAGLTVVEDGFKFVMKFVECGGGEGEVFMDWGEGGDVEGYGGGEAGIMGEVEGVEAVYLGTTLFGGSEKFAEVVDVDGIRVGCCVSVATFGGGGAFHWNIGKVEGGVNSMFDVSEDVVDACAEFRGAWDGGEGIGPKVEIGGEGGDVMFKAIKVRGESIADGAEGGVLVGVGKGVEEFLMFLVLGISKVSWAMEAEPVRFIVEFDGDFGYDGVVWVGDEFIKLVGGVGIGERQGEDDRMVVR